MIRHETAASVTHLVQLLCQTNELPSELRVLDLCTGTGCIPLLFQHEFSKRQDVQLELLGLDISRKAIDLARHNRDRVLREEKYAQACSIDFRRADVLLDPFGNQTDGPMCVMAALNFYRKRSFWDILISNPPYISPSEYWKTTQRSVRGFEPALALVPPATGGISDLEQGHRFYPRLLQIVRDVEAKIVLFEVADLDQALRVAQMAREMRVFDGIEIWRDQPDQDAQSEQANFPIVGAGNGRSVFCWRGPGGSWLMKTPTERSVIPHDRIG
jgi:methylase of polypeptide subunit release factors